MAATWTWQPRQKQMKQQLLRATMLRSMTREASSDFLPLHMCQSRKSARSKKGQRKGATSKNVKKCQDIVRQFSCRSKSVRRQKVPAQFSTVFDKLGWHQVLAFWGLARKNIQEVCRSGSQTTFREKTLNMENSRDHPKIARGEMGLYSHGVMSWRKRNTQ